MADEAQQDVQTEQVEQPESSAVTENTEAAQPTEHMIPKSRFDEINAELKRYKAEQSKLAKAQEEQARKAAEEQGKFKELYEEAQRKIAEAETRAKQLEMQALRAKVAKTVGIPDVLANRLVGETEEELEADAKTLLATLPKPQAPNINANSGPGATPSSNGVPDKETLLALGLNPRVHLGG